MTSTRCNELRAAWIDAPFELPERGAAALDGHEVAGSSGEQVSDHLGECEPCRAWCLRQSRLTQAVAGLPRLHAPAELEERVFDGLETRSSARLLRDFARTSPVRPAPAVLDRLVAEELSDPAGQRARRFLGDLDRVSVPDALEERLPELHIQSVREVPRSRAVHRASWAGFAAAAIVLVWVSVSTESGGSSTDVAVGTRVRSDYGFTVRRVHSISELDPLAAGLVHGLSGLAPTNATFASGTESGDRSVPR